MSISQLSVEYLAERGLARVYRDGTCVLYVYHGSSGGAREGNDIEEGGVRKERKRRLYTIDRKSVRSACVELWRRRKSKYLLFLTVTFPGFPAEREAAKAWDQLLDNLRITYNVQQYVWVKELQKRGVVHYHILLDAPYIDIVRLQGTFNRICCNQGLETSKNSVRLGRRPVVYGVGRVKNYLGKYIAKGASDDKFEYFEGRAHAHSEFFEIYDTIDFPEFVELLRKYDGVLVWECKFAEIYRLNEKFVTDNFG